MLLVGVLVGHGVVGVAAEVGRVWHEALDSRSMRVVVLRGPSGSGKTRVLQAWYELIVDTADAPHYEESGGRVRYWPRVLTPDSAHPPQLGASGLPWVSAQAPVPHVAGVDAVFPGGVWTPPVGSRPGLFWWGLRGVAGQCAALTASAQVRVHLQGLNQALQDADELTKDRLRALLDLSCWVNALAGLAVPALAPVAVAGMVLDVAGVIKDSPSVGRGVKSSRRTRQGLVEASLTQARLRELDLSLGANGAASAQDAFRVLAAVASVLPFAVVADDAAFLDEVTLAGLRTLALSSQGVGVIVLTVNTDLPAEQSAAVRDWVSALENTSAVSLNQLDVPALSGPESTVLATTVLDVEGLPVEGLHAEPLAAVVAAAGGNPGALLDLIEQPLVHAAVSTGTSLPCPMRPRGKTTRLSQALRALPEQTRRALAVLSVLGERVWEPWATTAVTPPHGHTRPGVNAEEIRQALETGCVHRNDVNVLEFTSPTAHQGARALADELLLPQDQKAVLECLATQLASARSGNTLDDLPVQVREAQLDTLTSPAAKALEIQPDPWCIAELARLRQVTGRTALTQGILADVRSRLANGLVSPVAVVATAQALFQYGQTQQALADLTGEYERLEARYGPANPAVLPPLTNLASAWAALAGGDIADMAAVDHAVALFRRVLELRHAARKPGQPLPARIPDTRARLTRLLHTAGRYAQAVDEGAIGLDEYNACPDYGPDHPDTLTARGNLVGYLSAAGRTDEAIPLAEQVLTDAEQILGPHHAATLTTRDNLALCMSAAGRTDEAIRLAEQVAADRERILGPDNPATLTTRDNLACYLHAAGRTAESLPLTEQVLTDRERILGPHHPNTLTARGNLARDLHAAGRTAKAIRLAEQVAADRERILGPHHPNTLMARHSLAGYLHAAGRTDEAIPLAEQVLTDAERILGPHHPNTLTARNNLAGYLHAAGPNIKA